MNASAAITDSNQLEMAANHFRPLTLAPRSIEWRSTAQARRRRTCSRGSAYKPTGGKVPLRRDVTRREPLGRAIERGGSSKLGMAGGLAARPLDVSDVSTEKAQIGITGGILRSLKSFIKRTAQTKFGMYLLGFSRLRAPVSRRDCVLSRRTAMNNTGLPCSR